MMAIKKKGSVKKVLICICCGTTGSPVLIVVSLHARDLMICTFVGFEVFKAVSLLATV
jgi:hypothetical protein